MTSSFLSDYPVADPEQLRQPAAEAAENMSQAERDTRTCFGQTPDTNYFGARA